MGRILYVDYPHPHIRLQEINKRQIAHMLGLLRLHLDKILFFRLSTDMQKYQAFSKLQADTRINKGPNIPIRDVFSFLIDARDPETGGLGQ